MHIRQRCQAAQTQNNGRIFMSNNEKTFMVPTRTNDPVNAFLHDLQAELTAIVAAVEWATQFPRGDIRRRLIKDGVVRYLNTKQQRARVLGITNFPEIVSQALQINRQL
jgi:hypothetical protein